MRTRQVPLVCGYCGVAPEVYRFPEFRTWTVYCIRHQVGSSNGKTKTAAIAAWNAHRRDHERQFPLR